LWCYLSTESYTAYTSNPNPNNILTTTDHDHYRNPTIKRSKEKKNPLKS
jgi:hypothetical protein